MDRGFNILAASDAVSIAASNGLFNMTRKSVIDCGSVTCKSPKPSPLS